MPISIILLAGSLAGVLLVASSVELVRYLMNPVARTPAHIEQTLEARSALAPRSSKAPDERHDIQEHVVGLVSVAAREQPDAVVLGTGSPPDMLPARQIDTPAVVASDPEVARLKTRVSLTLGLLDLQKDAADQERRRADALADNLAQVKNELNRLTSKAVLAQGGGAEEKQAITQERARADALARDLLEARHHTREIDGAFEAERQKAETLAAEVVAARKEIEQLTKRLDAATVAQSVAAAANSAANGAAAQQSQALAAERQRADQLARQVEQLKAQLVEVRVSESRLLEATRAAEAAARREAEALAADRQKAETLAAEVVAARKKIEQLTNRLDAATQVDKKDPKVAAEAAVARQESTVEKHWKDNALIPQLTSGGELGSGAAAAHVARVIGAPVLVKTTSVSAETQRQIAPSTQPSGAPEHTADNAGQVHQRHAVGGERDQNEHTTQSSVGSTPASRTSTHDAPILSRVEALIRQGDIAGARLLLEHSIQRGSAQAAFALAETYDPHILSAWRTRGIRGDPIKARALYTRAYAGGITEASNRADALK
jgi:hypothetical protein